MTQILNPKLAVNGGAKVRETPWPVRRLFGEREKDAVMKLFDRAIADGSHLLGYNGEQEQFYCNEFAEYLGGGFADGVNSGTNALHVALRSLDLEPAGEVIVPPITDPGGMMPVVLNHCIPIVADSAPGSYNTGAEQIAERLTDRTRAIIVAHVSGIPVDMDPVLDLAKARGIPVIEDCAQSHGATYRGRKVGRLGEVSAFSTMFGKQHSTGGQGGVVFTRNKSRYWRVRQVADRGKPFGLEGEQTNVVAALNCNMDELHAAIGRVQLQRLPEMIRWRQKLAGLVDDKLRNAVKTIRLVTGPTDSESSYWFLVLRGELERWTVSKHAFAEAVVAEGVPFESRYRPAPLTQEWFQKRAVFGKSGLPWTDAFRAREISMADLPNMVANAESVFTVSLHEGWTEREAEDLVETLQKVESSCLR